MPNTSGCISTKNSIARIQNSARVMGTSALVPLVSAATGNAIVGFPATLGDLNQLTGSFRSHSFWFYNAWMTCNTYLLAFAGVNIKAILRALEEPETGTVAECRSRLLISIGVVMQTV